MDYEEMRTNLTGLQFSSLETVKQYIINEMRKVVNVGIVAQEDKFQKNLVRAWWDMANTPIFTFYLSENEIEGITVKYGNVQ